jgi:hypothetical protein
MPADRRHQLTARALVLSAGLLCGCGSSHATPRLSAAAAAQMDSHLREVETAALAGEATTATGELNAFATDVARQKASGELTSAVYAALETGIGRARARIGVEVAPPPAAAATTATTPAAGATLPTVTTPASPATTPAAGATPGPSGPTAPSAASGPPGPVSALAPSPPKKGAHGGGPRGGHGPGGGHGHGGGPGAG